jgi:hypothetical protein
MQVSSRRSYKNSVRASDETQQFTITNINWLLPFTEIIGVVSLSVFLRAYKFRYRNKFSVVQQCDAEIKQIPKVYGYDGQ